MNDLQQLFEQFQIHLLDTDKQDIIAQIAAPLRGTQAERMKIYSHAYRTRLQEIIKLDFPVLQQIIGRQEFIALVNRYLDAYPSEHYSVGIISRYMRKFLQQYPYQDKPYLAELAQFEWALQEVIDAPDVPMAAIADLQNLAPQAWPAMVLRFHPSVQILICHWDICGLWHNYKDEIQGNTIVTPTAGTQYILVWRKDNMAYFNTCDAHEKLLLDNFAQGKNFAEICELCCEVMTEEEIAPFAVQCMQRWLHSEMITAIEIRE